MLDQKLDPKQVIWDDEQVAALMRIDKRTLINRYSKGDPMPPYIEVRGSRIRLYVPEKVVEWLVAHSVAAKVVRRPGRPPKDVSAQKARLDAGGV